MYCRIITNKMLFYLGRRLMLFYLGRREDAALADLQGVL